MKILFWILAFVITASVAVYQRVTGPSYPIKGEISVHNEIINYNFNRSQEGQIDSKVNIPVKNKEISGILFWKRYNTEDDWSQTIMMRTGDTLFASLPAQPPAGKLEYFIRLSDGTEDYKLPPDESVIIRFKGEVPNFILYLHIIAMFGAMLLSTRTGFEFFSKEPKHVRLTIWTIGFLIAGGLILGPVIQKYAFDAYWTGFPFGHDLTDNKTVVALLGWVIAFLMYKRSDHPKRWALFASVLLIVVYLIPHSVLGSELDYDKIDKEKSSVEFLLNK